MTEILTGVNEYVLGTASTDTSFDSIAATTTEPTADCLTFPGGAGLVHNNLLLIPFGTDADGEAFDIRVVGWQKVSTLWVPTILFQGSCTLSTAVGVSGAAVTDSNYFVDTITATALMGIENVNYTIHSPANNTPAHVMVDIKGYRKVEVNYDLDTAASANCIYKVL